MKQQPSLLLHSQDQAAQAMLHTEVSVFVYLNHGLLDIQDVESNRGIVGYVDLKALALCLAPHDPRLTKHMGLAKLTAAVLGKALDKSQQVSSSHTSALMDQAYQLILPSGNSASRWELDVPGRAGVWQLLCTSQF